MKSFLRYLSQRFNRLTALFTTQHNKSTGRAFIQFLEENKNAKEELLDKLFLFSTAEIITGQQEVVDFNLLLNKIQKRIQPILDEIKINFTYNKLPKIQSHSASMEKVFEDLMTYSISNILQSDQIKDGKIEVTCARIQSNLYQFSIKDNGAEVDETQLAAAFNLFKASKEKNVFTSSGLGLARAKRIIATHGGEIQLFAEKGNGNCLIFTVQHTDEEGQQRPISDTIETASQRSQRKEQTDQYYLRRRG